MCGAFVTMEINSMGVTRKSGTFPTGKKKLGG